MDEQLVCFRRRCTFKQYIPSKSDKYGKTTGQFATPLALTHGKCKCKDAGSCRETNQGTRVVLDLVEDIEKSGKNITCNYFFTNLSLARKLLQKKLTLVGTMRKNKPELPMEFTVAKGRNVNSIVFGFQQDAMNAFYCYKKSCSQYSFDDT